MKTEASEYLSLLQKIQNNNVSTFTVMPADEPRFTIETNSRNIIVPSEFSFLSVQNDHRAETIYFEIDRYFDNVDLSQHTCVVQFINKSGTTINEGTYPVTSMDIDSVDGKIVFGWEIRNDATQLTGDITFSVRFYSIDNNGNFTYNFNTLTASSYILPSLNIIASGERITATELEVWTDKMNNLTSSIESDIITVEEKIEELENYIASIPEDYTALTEEVSKLSGDIVEVKEDIGELQSSIYNTHQEYIEVTNGLVELSDFGITKISSTTFTVESSSTNNIKGCRVKEGEKIKITCYTFNEYIGFGYVWASTEQTPEKWNGSNALPMLSSDTYDYFCGNTEKVWKTYEMELTVPSGAKMIWVRTENSYPIYKFTKINESKIPTKTSQLENDGLMRNPVFFLSTPTVSVGTLENQLLHVIHNKSVPIWKFSNAGTIDFGDISIPHNSDDTVGLWIYCNETMLSVRGNTDGTMKVYIDGTLRNEINTAYAFRVGWNYLPIEVLADNFSLKIAFTLVRGDYEFAIDSIELNYVPKVKPKILLSFDMGTETMYTNRHLLLKEYGFRATYANIWGVSEENRNKMLAYGDDWAIYGNDSTSSTVYPGDNATVEEFEEYLQKTIDRAESIGLFNPISYFSPNNAGFQNLMQALKNKGYRIGRTAVSGQYAIDYFGKDSFYINTYGVGGEETSANVLKAVDDAINVGNSICIFTHDILENPSDNMNAKKSTYVEILDGIKDRVNAGKCEVCTFTDFYREWMPNDCAEYLENRHEKEKQYIIGKLSS